MNVPFWKQNHIGLFTTAELVAELARRETVERIDIESGKMFHIADSPCQIWQRGPATILVVKE